MVQITQIKKLTTSDLDLTNEQQRQIVGGGAGPHLYIAPSEEKQEELWSGYHQGDYDIEVQDRYKNQSGTFVVFKRNTSSRTTSNAGVIKL